MSCHDVDLYIRYESLELGLNSVLTERGYTAGIELPTVGVTVGKPNWTDLWFPGLAKYAVDHYGDITKYQYRTIFDGLTAIGSEPTSFVTVEP